MSSQELFVCSICLQFESDVSPNWFVTTPEGHVFHFNGCLKEWVAKGGNCPLCNETIDFSNLTRLHGIDPSCKHVEYDVTKGNGSTSGINNGNAARSLADTGNLLTSRIPDYTFNIILLGDRGVGKSSLLQRYAHGVFNYKISSTVGLDVAIKKIEVMGKVITMTLWDTCGQEEFKAISKSFVRNAHGVVMTYSYERDDSLDSVNAWLEFIDSCGLPGAAVLLVGNKVDIPQEQRCLTTEQGQNVARSLGLQFFETSARDDFNVDAVFRALAVTILHQIGSRRLEYRNRIRLRKHGNSKKSSKCCW